MKNIEVLYSNRQIKITELPIDNSRKLMKFKIYLNSYKTIKYELNDSILFITFEVYDENRITQEISKIIDFLKNTFECSISLDESLAKKINDNNNNVVMQTNRIKTLKELKESNILENKSFIDYCGFCNSSLKCLLRPYQYTASYYLCLGNGGFNFSVPGSGKTIIAYAAYNFYKTHDICSNIIIIGPINSSNAWFDEYYTCFEKKPDFISLANKQKDEVLAYLLSSSNNHKEITFINIDKAWMMKNEIVSFLQNKKILLIIDEAHKEKNPDAEITKAVLEITKYANCRIILTGTPMPNGYEDLFSLMKIYSPYEKILPYSYSDLKRLSKNGLNEIQRSRIMNSIFPLYSRVSKRYLLDNGELTEPKYTLIKCEMSQDQSQIYDFVNKIACDINDDFESAININFMKAILIRKMQISANPGLLMKSIINTIDEYRKDYIDDYDKDDSDNELLLKADNKIKNIISQSDIVKLINRFENNFINTPKNLTSAKLAIEIVAKGEKVIIWDIFVQNMYSIKKTIHEKYNGQVEIINGMVNGIERQQAIENFKRGDSMILIANPATLAESISLHKACQSAIYVNRNFNAAQFIQSKDRIHRINMPVGKTANYFFIINENTVDEEVQKRLELKETRMLKILDSNELVIGGNEFDNCSFMSLDDVIESFKK